VLSPTLISVLVILHKTYGNKRNSAGLNPGEFKSLLNSKWGHITLKGKYWKTNVGREIN
jgi:hypothetical protein